MVGQEAGKTRAFEHGALPRGLSRVEAARYVGVSPTTFDKMVDDKIMPPPIRVYARTLWDIRAIDAAFDALDSTAADNQDDAVWSRAAV